MRNLSPRRPGLQREHRARPPCDAPRARLLPHLALLLALATGCPASHAAPPSEAATSQATTAPGTCGVCAQYAVLPERGPKVPRALRELSGLTVSRNHPGVRYALNDSGGGARFYALNAAGGVRAELRLEGARVEDLEDLALGPCPEGSCLFLADIGDNARERRHYAVLRVPEPATLPPPGSPPVSLPFTALPFTYPDGRSRDAEALLVHPATGALYVVTKRKGHHPSEVFALGTAGTPARLVAELTVPPPGERPITGGAIHPCAARVLLRTNTHLYELSAPAGAPFEAVFHAEPHEVPAPDEHQGEAVAYAADGRGYLTAGEGKRQRVHTVRCAE